MRLSKLHGLGNDFLVLLDDGAIGPVSPAQARALCARRRGIGADGLIRSERAGAGVVTFDLLNADGGPAEMSGNGARCLGLAAARAGWWPERSQPLVLRTPAGDRRLDWEGGDLEEAELRVAMGRVTGEPAKPVEGLGDETWHGWTVNVGNPHAVTLLDGPLPARAELEARLAGFEAGGPADRNFEFVVRGPEVEAVTMVVRERGAGWTEACGTGSVAAAWSAHEAGWVGARVTVHNPGGTVQVELAGAQASLVGPAVFVAEVDASGLTRGGVPLPAGAGKRA